MSVSAVMTSSCGDHHCLPEVLPFATVVSAAIVENDLTDRNSATSLNKGLPLWLYQRDRSEVAPVRSARTAGKTYLTMRSDVLQIGLSSIGNSGEAERSFRNSFVNPTSNGDYCRDPADGTVLAAAPRSRNRSR